MLWLQLHPGKPARFFHNEPGRRTGDRKYPVAGIDTFVLDVLWSLPAILIGMNTIAALFCALLAICLMDFPSLWWTCRTVRIVSTVGISFNPPVSCSCRAVKRGCRGLILDADFPQRRVIIACRSAFNTALLCVRTKPKGQTTPKGICLFVSMIFGSLDIYRAMRN